jgi:membrane-associated phospholipid phosphatase
MLTEYIKILAQKFVDFFYGIGYFGEQIAFFVTLFLISPTYPHIYTYAFVAITLLNKAINEFLKAQIQDPRPADSQKFLVSERFTHRKTYGMPSGHTQGVGFALTYAYLLTHEHLAEFVVFAGCVLYERYIFKNHTLLQLIAGLITGSVLAFLTYQVAKEAAFGRGGEAAQKTFKN